jgi:hypothetical protein
VVISGSFTFAGGLGVDDLAVDGFDVDGLTVDGLDVDGFVVDGLLVDGLVDGLDASGFDTDGFDAGGFVVECVAGEAGRVVSVRLAMFPPGILGFSTAVDSDGFLCFSMSISFSLFTRNGSL